MTVHYILFPFFIWSIVFRFYSRFQIFVYYFRAIGIVVPFSFLQAKNEKNSLSSPLSLTSFWMWMCFCYILQKWSWILINFIYDLWNSSQIMKLENVKDSRFKKGALHCLCDAGLLAYRCWYIRWNYIRFYIVQWEIYNKKKLWKKR